MSSADNLCKQFEPRSGPTKCRAWSGTKLFDTLMVFLKEYFWKSWFWKKSADDKKACKIIEQQNKRFNCTYPKSKEEPITSVFCACFFLSFHLSRSQRKNERTLIILFLYIDRTIMSSSIPAGQTLMMTMKYILSNIKGAFFVSSDKTLGSWLRCQPCHTS